MFIHISEGTRIPKYHLYKSELPRADSHWDELNISTETKELAVTAAQGLVHSNPNYYELCPVCCKVD